MGAGIEQLGSDQRLVTLLREEIETAPEQRITFARFMERALTEPGLGYYAISDTRPTRSGDFLTAPELHPFFGRCVGRLLADAWRRMGCPVPFVVREWGAGRGTLGRTAREGLAADGSALGDAIAWQPVDLPDRLPAPGPGPFCGAVVANEYLDALPFHRLVVRQGRLREAWVTWVDDGFAWAEAGLSSPVLAEPLEAAGVTLAEGLVAEVRPGVATWMADVARSLERGLVLVIDYGHEAAELYGPRGLGGSLATYRSHVVGDDPFQAVGRQDITAHVDLEELRRAAVACGLAPTLDTTVAGFVAQQGLGELLSDLGRDPATDPQAYVDARAAALRLLDPRHLGRQRVLTFERT